MRQMTLHVNLRIEGATIGVTQPVEVTEIGQDQLQVLHSPGLVEGIAADDIIHLTCSETGEFTVVSRGGNVAVKWAASEIDDHTFANAEDAMQTLGARLDGRIERAAVWTVPFSVGFAAIEDTMSKLIAFAPGSEWWYGNVYDANGSPLNWWLNADGDA